MNDVFVLVFVLLTLNNTQYAIKHINAINIIDKKQYTQHSLKGWIEEI